MPIGAHGKQAEALYDCIINLRHYTHSFADRVSHPVDPRRRSLHVLRAGGSAQNGQSPERSESAAHAVNQN